MVEKGLASDIVAALCRCMRDGCAIARGWMDRARGWALRRVVGARVGARRALRGALHGEEGQGTTEYAILVGVLVVIAIAAILLFRGKIQELWDAIASSLNNL